MRGRSGNLSSVMYSVDAIASSSEEEWCLLTWMFHM